MFRVYSTTSGQPSLVLSAAIFIDPAAKGAGFGQLSEAWSAPDYHRIPIPK